MQASAPDLDYDTCIKCAREMAKKFREYEDVVSKSQNSFFFDHFNVKMEHYKKELIIYARLANYMKHIEIESQRKK